MGFFDNLFSKKEEYSEIDYNKYSNISNMINEILNGPFASREQKPDSGEYMWDGYHSSEYKDDFFTISSFSGTGIGMGRVPSSTDIVLNNGVCVYSNDRVKKCELWYDHLVDVYNKSKEIKERRYNLDHRITDLFKYVPSGYDDGIIHVEYEKSYYTYHNYSEEEDVTEPIYTCSIYLIQAGEYVYVADAIHNKRDAIRREGLWVDYVCTLIDKFELEERKRREEENKRRRELENLKKQVELLKKQHNNRPIDDAYIFRR